MKRLGLAIVAVLVSVSSMSYAQSNNTKLHKAPFAVSFEKLSKYLDLAPYQMDEVANINEYFIEMQDESVKSSVYRQEKKMHQAVYGNLKLMKEALTPAQYRKYLVLLNVTNNNYRAMGIQAMPDDTYLAENIRK
ncbi:hypothetical protein M2459_002025 [Parabacteroides sp. PF5-5]|uniref:hypothetical protein n=1 Tax=unclassified Parabacteroides TaxID=2649774 RepID=UPI0024770551|nr:MULTISPECIES: hypothetical protein [unclassified Parabacteroides]MDH6305556.1 hypothetical protein [Parabacteroides sp. PH5-39]MDH6316404.1 hypothetical protein [Parabacteroides sp. PF5-13]MDH6319889.1 hypothetical protein [Parabacteroides sp. PH5-13]MDH6323520.1 hypothetical protein [Parabacteroides sp. PH5-8]MDH6327591.1 hypothetical protein [Parabacteroides sp. PH5-41]